jgi:hypothetical protein
MRKAMKRLSSLKKGDKFLIDLADAIEYEYLWESCIEGEHTCKDHDGEWCRFRGGMRVIPVGQPANELTARIARSAS